MSEDKRMQPMSDRELGELTGLLVGMNPNIGQSQILCRAFERLAYLEEQQRKESK